MSSMFDERRHVNCHEQTNPAALKIYNFRNTRKRRYKKFIQNPNELQHLKPPPIKRCKLSPKPSKTRVQTNTSTNTSPIHFPTPTANTNPNTNASKTINVKFKLFGEQFHEHKMRTSHSIAIHKPPNIRMGKRTLEQFSVPINCRSIRRSPFICAYAFANNWHIFIDNTLGRGKEVKQAIRILSQDLTGVRAKATMHTNKHVFLCWISTPNGRMTACAIMHRDYNNDRMNIEMFAVHRQYRKRGLADIMLYAIQHRMMFLSPDCRLYVSAALSAVPFWLKGKYGFKRGCVKLLEQYEIDDEKKGNTLHFIWKGDSLIAKYELLKRFLVYEQNMCEQ